MMAGARTPRVDKLDPEKINGQWRDWRDRMENFETSDESEKESLLKELAENIPERLIELEDCIKLFLENRFHLEYVFWITSIDEQLLDSIENMSTKKQIESGQLYRLDRLKEKLTGANIHGYRGCTLVLHHLKGFSDGLKSMKSEKDRSDEQLLDMIYDSSSIFVDEMKKANERCKEERWLGTLLILYKRMMKDAQLLNTRMSDTLHVLKSKPSSFELLTEMKSTLENAIESILESDSKVILDPETEYSHVCPENPDVVVTFSSGTVQSSQEIHIALEPVSVEECDPLTEVAGYSDVIDIQHDEEFQKPVIVTTSLVLIGDYDISSCDLFCVHMDDNELKIQEDVKVEVLKGNLCRFATYTINRNVVHAIKKVIGNERRDPAALLKELQNIHKARPHNILVFIGTGSGNESWKLHTEVVDEENVKDIIDRRNQERSVFELPECRSPSLIMKGIERIEVDLGDEGALEMHKSSPVEHPVINIVPDGKNNFISFLVKRKDTENMATVNFQRVGRKRRLLHSTNLDSSVLDKFQYQATAQTYASGNTSDTQETSDFFGDKSMLSLTNQIPEDYMYQLAILLEITMEKYHELKSRYPKEWKMTIMKHWLQIQTCSCKKMKESLCKALENADLKRIAMVVASVYGKQRALKKSDFR